MYKYGKEAYLSLDEYIHKLSPSNILIIDDENTHQYCYPELMNHFDFNHNVISIKPGENNKNIETVTSIWEKMLEMDLDKKSLVINLGGGIVTDLGGFVASNFKRGMPFIHIPTSLLGMVDAAIGGKNGINFGGAKNQIGVIIPPEMVLIDSQYIKTLPKKEIKSGYAEMLKHGIIANENYWDELLADIDNLENLDQNIKKSVEIKHRIITQDPNEKGLRKILNFGHTLGHAIESYSHDKNTPLTHGHAVALGMILAAYLSFKQNNLKFTFVNSIKNVLLKHYPLPSWSKGEIKKILDYLKFDKKNISGKILFVLLDENRKPVFNQEVHEGLIYEAFDYLLD